MYRHQTWLCAEQGCTRAGSVAVFVVLQSQGGRKERRKANTKAVRLCQLHLRQLVKGMAIKAVASQVEEAGRKVVPDAWDTKPKLVK